MSLRNAADNKEKLYFEQTYPDGTKVTFEGQVSVKLGGGGGTLFIEFTPLAMIKFPLQALNLAFYRRIGRYQWMGFSPYATWKVIREDKELKLRPTIPRKL